MDGGETDETVTILKKYPHIDWVSEKDGGQTNAVNKALRKARGEIIGWINSDDTFLPGAFEGVVGRFLTDPECFVVFGDYHATDERGNILYSTEGFAGNCE